MSNVEDKENDGNQGENDNGNDSPDEGPRVDTLGAEPTQTKTPDNSQE